MPSQVNPDYILPNYRPNYRVPQTRTVRTPAQPNRAIPMITSRNNAN
jgi:hypothetical protein